jgi:CO/xanthine dehydrogenase FAD-binding subunit
MKTFGFQHATTIEDAIHAVVDTGGMYFAGGTNLIDLMKRGVEATRRLSTLADSTSPRSHRPASAASSSRPVRPTALSPTTP